MTLTDALFDEYADGVCHAATVALAKAFLCVGGAMPRGPFWERVRELRRVLDAGRAYFEPADFLRRFRTRRTGRFDFTGRAAACDCLQTLVDLALCDDLGGPRAAACVGVLKDEFLPAAAADWFHDTED